MESNEWRFWMDFGCTMGCQYFFLLLICHLVNMFTTKHVLKVDIDVIVLSNGWIWFNRTYSSLKL
jgi:hypothetical protein